MIGVDSESGTERIPDEIVSEFDEFLKRISPYLDNLSSNKTAEDQVTFVKKERGDSLFCLVWFPKISTKTPLTDIEKKIIQMIASGFSNKKISEKLGITINTVACHIGRIKIKLNVNSRAVLSRYSIALL